MFTDLVGYSAISHRDEALALELLEEHRKLLRPFFARRAGREVKTIGDGFLIEFASALDAVECALEIQSALLARNFGVPRERQFRVRIGIHLGDIVERDGDVYGDGVNIAARLQGRCEVGGVCFSRQIHDQVHKRLSAPVRKLRPKRLKNIPELIDAYLARPDGPGALIRGDRSQLRLLPHSPLNKRRSAALGFIAASILAGAAFVFLAHPSHIANEAAEENSHLDPNRIAVLPFHGVGLAPGDEYLGDGITAELISHLSGMPSVRVIARTSTERYRQSPRTASEIGRELGVGSLIEGTLTASGGQLRVDVEFIDVRTQEAVWSQRVQESADRVFELQEKVSWAVASRLKARNLASALNPPAAPLDDARGEGAAGPGHEAYLAYLRGRYFLGQRTQASIWKAMQLFESATRLDPNFTRAYVGIATGYGLLGYYEFVSPFESLKRGEEFAAKALAIDPASPEALTSMAAQKVYFDHDWVGAERNFRRALALRPSDASAHEWYGEFLVAMGRDAEARKEIGAALALDPLSLIINTVAGHPDYFKGDFHRAIEHYRAALEMDPSFEPARLWLARAYVLNGQAGEAITLLGSAASGPGPMPTEDTKLKAALALAYAATGDRAAARRILDELGRGGTYVSPYELAAVHARLGDNTQALTELKQAYADRAFLSVYYQVDPLFSGLRKDPGMRELVARLFPKGP